MAFLITYHPPTRANSILPGIFQSNKPQQIDWITPEGWSSHDAKRAFEAQHPGAVVLRCDAILSGQLA